MRVAICYYSGSGNTEMVCRFIQEKIKHVDFDLINVTECKRPDLKKYGSVGFASPTFYMGIPEIFNDFLKGMEEHTGKPAFLINTFGMMQGKTLKLVNKAVTNRGFNVIAAHSLNMPESYPLFLAKGWTSEDKPDEKQIHDLREFTSELSLKLERVERGERLPEVKVNITFLDNIIPVKNRIKISKVTGEFKVDTSLCSQCGLCVKQCPYKAVNMESYPVFNHSKCWSCFKCYNHCPQKAIFTDKVKGNFQYEGPGKKLSEKLKSGEGV